MTAEKLRDRFFKEHTEKDEHGIPIVTTHPHNLFEWFASQGTKEEGWVIVDPEGAVLTDSFKASFGSCAMANSITVMEWKKKVEKGYKCVIAERTTKLIEG